MFTDVCRHMHQQFLQRPPCNIECIYLESYRRISRLMLNMTLSHGLCIITGTPGSASNATVTITATYDLNLLRSSAVSGRLHAQACLRCDNL